MKQHESVDSRRLFEAADALLKAVESKDGVCALVPMYLVDPSSETHVPAGAFTQEELIEAMSLLIRIGLIESADERGHPPSFGK